MCRPAPASSPIPTRNSSSRNASTRRRRYSAPPKRPSASPARCAGGSSLPLISPAPILLAGRWFSRHHTAEGEKAGYCSENSPKRHIDSHVVILHGRPCSINRAPGRRVLRPNVAAAKLLVWTTRSMAGRKAMQRARRLVLGFILTLLPAFALAVQTAAAQTSWPTGPVRLIMPYPPATSGDLITRKVAPFLSQKLGAPFFVENRPGANGNIGMKAVKDSLPDGTTFVSASDIQFAVSPAVYANLSYDMDRDFTPVAPLARIINVIVANRNHKADNLRELVALAKAQPGKFPYASTGVGSTHQLFMEMLKMQ